MILIDPRNGSAHMAPLFEALSMPCELTHLGFGDCAFIGEGPTGPVRVGIEIKGGRGGSDFLQSMQSGRLVGHQIPGLVDSYDRQYLMVEGVRVSRNGLVWQTRRRGEQQPRPIFMSDIEKFLTGVEEWGVRIRYTNTPEATARVIVKILYAFWEKPYDSHSSVNTLYEAPTGLALRAEDEATARIRRVVHALKVGIGASRSKAVAQHFGSVEQLALGDVDEWTRIPGIGKAIAQNAHEAIRESIPAASAGRIPEGRAVAVRGARHTRQRQDAGVDERHPAQRRVHASRAGPRKSHRHRAE